ncbi:hypothetical protein Hanom_Chr07g00666131 [Helianthus anomalus]
MITYTQYNSPYKKYGARIKNYDLYHTWHGETVNEQQTGTPKNGLVNRKVLTENITAANKQNIIFFSDRFLQRNM